MMFILSFDLNLCFINNSHIFTIEGGEFKYKFIKDLSLKFKYILLKKCQTKGQRHDFLFSFVFSFFIEMILVYFYIYVCMQILEKSQAHDHWAQKYFQIIRGWRV